MFSIFHGLFTMFALGMDKYDRTSQDMKNKIMAKENGLLTYRGSRGNEYLVENDRWVSTKRNNKGEDVIVDMKTGKIYYNLTKMKKRKKGERLLKEGKTVRFKMYNEDNRPYYGKYKIPYSLVDIHTDTPINEVIVNFVKFYQDLDTGHIIRMADGENCEKKVGKYNETELINLFNKRQDRMKDELNKHKNDLLWLQNNYFFTTTNYIYIDSKNGFNIFNLLNGSRNMWLCINNDKKER